MTVTIDIPSELEARMSAEARACGVPLPQFVRDLLVDNYEETVDLREAESRLEHRQPAISVGELRKNLGLDR